MAKIADIITPYEGVMVLADPMPYGDIITPYEAGTPDLLGALIANRFPTPASAVGFLIDPLGSIGEAIVIDGIDGDLKAGILAPQSYYLEPKLGQIWPRIG